MSEMRKREVADAATNEAEPKRAQSVLIYGEQRYEYAADVPYTTQMAANYLWIGWCGMLGVLVRLCIEDVTDTKPYTLGLTGALYANILGCFLYGVFARSYVAKNAPALYCGLTVGFCGCLTTFSSWAVDAAAHFCRGNGARGVATLVFPLWIFLGCLELGLFVGDAIEAGCTNSASLEKLEPGDVKVPLPDEARLPRYHSYKLHIGAVLFALLLAASLIVVGLNLPGYAEQAAAVAMAPLGAWTRYHLSGYSKGRTYPAGTLIANFAATALDALAGGLLTKTEPSEDAPTSRCLLAIQ